MRKMATMRPFRTLLYVAAVLRLPLRVAGAQQYCSSQNTGSDYSAVTNIYNSNGACTTQCQGSYAFAIVQYQNCWCSNYIPASQENVGNCNENCPGYPSEKCGNESEGLFGYIALNIAPYGTAGASSSLQSSSASSSSSTTTSTPTTTSSSSIPSSSFPPTPSTSSVPSSQPSQTVETPSTSSTSSQFTSSTINAVVPIGAAPTRSEVQTEPSASPIMSFQIVTVSGAIVTRTVISTPTAKAAAPSSGTDNVPFQRNVGLSAGAIAGVVIGALAALALLAIAAVLFWRRKRQSEDGETVRSNSGSKKGLGRNVSVLSKSGLLSRGRPSMAETHHDEAVGSSSARHSMMFAGVEGVHPESPLGSSHGGSERRSSKPMVYDQRLNPSALFGNLDNGSRVSMQDQQDYSRPLGVMNPDIRASFDSRISRVD